MRDALERQYVFGVVVQLGFSITHEGLPHKTLTPSGCAGTRCSVGILYALPSGTILSGMPIIQFFFHVSYEPLALFVRSVV